MDKEYLIHNIDCTDNPEDGHLTLNITISNLELDAPDMTATIGIDTFVNGMQASSNKYEDVSLTGAGGELPTCNITLVPKINNEIVPGPFFTWQIIGNTVFSEENDFAAITQGNDPESTNEFTFPRQIFNPGTLALFDMSVVDSGGAVVWDGTEPVNLEGSVSWDSDNNRIILTGDCTITFNAFRD